MKKVISGGQNGIDQLGLKVAKLLGLTTGGTAPNNFMTSTGPQEKLLKKYNLKEIKGVSNNVQSYVRRTIINIEDSDLTLVFLLSESNGSLRTIDYAVNGKWNSGKKLNLNRSYIEFKRCIIIQPLRKNYPNKHKRNLKKFKKYLKINRVKVINIAGNSKVYNDIEEIMTDYLKLFV